MCGEADPALHSEQYVRLFHAVHPGSYNAMENVIHRYKLLVDINCRTSFSKSIDNLYVGIVCSLGKSVIITDHRA